MFKKTAILLFLLLMPLVVPVTVEKTLKVNETTTVNGKNFYLEKIGLDFSSIVSVDGIKGIVPFRENSTKNINGAILLAKNLTYVDQTDAWVTLQITIDYVCGDNLCNETQGEDSKGCCTDCGCKKDNYVCTKNICEMNTCIINADCNDNNECTEDKCGGAPKKCSYKKLPDCPKNITIQNAKKEAPEVKNKTKGVECELKACIINETCFDQGSILNNEFCSNSVWLERKRESQDCSNNYECLNNQCMVNKCKAGSDNTSAIFVSITTIITLIFGLIIHKRYFTS